MCHNRRKKRGEGVCVVLCVKGVCVCVIHRTEGRVEKGNVRLYVKCVCVCVCVCVSQGA